MHLGDYIVIILYFFSVLALGFYRNKNSSKNSNNYILDGRKLSLPGFVATLVTTWYGGILGIGENTYNFGIQTWFIFAFPYYIFAILFAMFIAPRIRKTKLVSIPDHFRNNYGKNAGIISGIFILILVSPAPYILSIGILLEYVLGVPFVWSLLLATFFSLIYIWKGGFGAVVKTDILQFVLMFAGFILLIIFAWVKLGSPIEVFAKLPKDHLSITGGQPISYIIVWFFIALWTFVDPGFYQRCAAAKDHRTAKSGILLSVVFWFIFDTLTLTSGLYARTAITIEKGLFSFPILGELLLPPLFFGLFITGLLATIMSTIDSLGFISAFTFGRDIIGQIKPNKWNAIHLTRTGLIVMAIIAILLAYILPSVVRLWYAIGSVIVPGLLIPFLATFSKKQFNKKQISLLMVLPVFVSIIWFLLNNLSSSGIFNIEPFYPGMITSVLIFISLFYKRNSKTRTV